MVTKKRISVQVADDYLQKLASSKRAIDALSELVWNSLDADATSVSINTIENGLSGNDKIIVKDNGSGFSSLDIETVFTNLGNYGKSERNVPERIVVFCTGRRAKEDSRRSHWD